MAVRRILALALFVTAAVCGAGAKAAELEFSRQVGSSSCTTLKCPPGINCDAYLKPMCEQCIAGQGNTFVIRCTDASCSSFSGMTCETQPADCSEAKENVDWVLVKDHGARNTFEAARRSGQSPFEALLTAQKHNPNAQTSIRRCRAWVGQYLASTYAGKLGPYANGPDASAKRGIEEIDLDCITVVSDVPRYAGSEGGLWHVDLHTENRCKVRVAGTFCVAFGRENRTNSAIKYFSPGESAIVRVTDPRLIHETVADKSYRYLSSKICSRDPPFRCLGSCN